MSVDVTCPDCGWSESSGMTPTLRLSADIEVTVKNVNCSNCGYEGPPDDKV